MDKGSLSGTVSVTMTRPSGGDSADAEAVWNDVFNLCGLLGPFNSADPDPDDGQGPTKLDTFDVEGGDWEVAKGGGKIWFSLGFTMLSPLDPNDPLFTDRLSVSLQLTRDCIDGVTFPSCDMFPADKLIPTSDGETVETVVENARIHLRGKAGVTHQAACHADDDVLDSSFSTLVITACNAGTPCPP